MIRSINHITFSCILLVSCLPDPLPVDNVPVPEKTVVIGSQNIPDEFLAISLTQNFNALEGGTENEIDSLIQALAIDDLTITIEVAGENYALINAQFGIYLGTDIPEIPGEFYTLNFDNPFNQKPVVATSQLLPSVGFDTLGVRLEETPFDTLVNVDLTFTDPPGPNWYMFNVQLFNEEYDIQDIPFTELLEDSEFDGQTLDYSFRVFFRDYVDGDSIFVSMANINKEYYDFLELRNDQRFLLLDGLGEPINYPTNVENGLGFFHLHIPDVRVFVVD